MPLFGTLILIVPPPSPQLVTVAAGNFLPGVPRNNAYAELTWRRGLPGFSAAVEAIYRDHIFANDINTEAASQYALANIRFAYSHRIGGWRFSEFMRVDNITATPVYRFGHYQRKQWQVLRTCAGAELYGGDKRELCFLDDCSRIGFALLSPVWRLQF